MTTKRLVVNVAVVGAGPAGLTAATGLARAGLRVALIDEQPKFGGQYYRQRSDLLRDRLGDFRPKGRQLIRNAADAGVLALPATMVWAVEGRQLWALTEGCEVQVIEADSIVIATGAFERQFPFDGWQAPGVVSVGLAAHMAGVDALAAGNRVIVAGSGPLLLPAAAAIARAGAQVIAVVEAGYPYRPSFGSLRTVAFPGRLSRFGRALATLVRHRARIIQGHLVIGVKSGENGQLRQVSLAPVGDRNGPKSTFDADALCMGYGFRPQAELFRLIGAAMKVDPATGDWFPRVDADGRTSIPGVYAAGEVSGIGGIGTALAEGRLVASAVLADLHGRTVSGSGALRRAKRREARFGELVARLYPNPARLAQASLADLPDSVQVCRCEAVTAGTIRAALSIAGLDISAVKQRTRAAMGPCQGRECGAALAGFIGEARPSLSTRPPVRPVPISAIVEAGRERVA